MGINQLVEGIVLSVIQGKCVREVPFGRIWMRVTVVNEGESVFCSTGSTLSFLGESAP